MRRVVIGVRLAGICFAACPFIAAAAQVTVILSDESAPYVEAANAFKETLARIDTDAPAVATTTAASFRDPKNLAPQDGAVVVTVGVAAAKAALDRGGKFSVLGILIPKQAVDAMHCDPLPSAQPRCTAIFLDQPLARQLNLIQSALPERRRLGVVLGPQSREFLKELHEAVLARKLTLVAQTVGDASELYPALQYVLPESDILLTIPDGIVLTTASARSLLVSAYRFQIPVVAFSENYVKAGAMLAVYSTPEQIGRQAAEQVAAALDGGSSLAIQSQYPKYFSVRVNYEVARSLGISIAEEQTLRSRLAGMRE